MLHPLEHGVDDNKGTCEHSKLVKSRDNVDNKPLACSAHACAAVGDHGTTIRGVEHVDPSGDSLYQTIISFSSVI